MTGVERIQAVFARAKAENRAVFMPYQAMGYPDRARTLEIIHTLGDVGAELFEIGIPHSDPLADGPTIQAATQVALRNGITARRCLDAVRELRARGVGQPMLLMGYLNPVLAYGPDAFARDARAAGADGLIVPDLPPEEADLLAGACAREGLALIFFLAPTSTDARIKLVAEQARGFLYVVSVTGVTGARAALPPSLGDFLARALSLRVVGFGISGPVTGSARKCAKPMMVVSGERSS